MRLVATRRRPIPLPERQTARGVSLQEGPMRLTHPRLLVLVAITGLLSSQVPAALIAGEQGQAQVRPARSSFKGLTYGEWMAVWWQEVFATAVQADSHPLLNGGTIAGNNGVVLLVAPVSPVGTPEVVIPVTVPHGTPLLMPIITVECSVAEDPPFHGEDETELRACANGLLDLVSDPYAEIDGTPVQDPGGYRAQSPLFRFGPLTSHNVLGERPGTQSDSVAAGYFLLLPSLGPGVHRITIRANVAPVGLAVDATFLIRVDPPRKR
jgi:hypothetical protein